ncbi:hypothetical protein [Hyalangium minutum]|uniref:Uncharacterized protein n=1 Tax=Hyalangium minutum TaxID=394096 RepID=A0A085W7B0_9BACT|nr:hypothetical protein [Hyalangium minutum]KFE63573.1 hypothetical protein DB31_2691 [Hyalangium minutum]
MSHPRYFVPHAATPAEPVRPDASALVNVVDTFRLEVRYLGEQEWIIGLDAVGQLLAVPGRDRAQLPASAQAQLAHHEVTSGRSPRRIAAHELFFFTVELVEHPEEAEGANDPVYLYGNLIGPWPGEELKRVPGQLTVSRGAVLAGLVHGAADAFIYAPDAEIKTLQRSYHGLLPGDRPEVIAEGRGLVLAYPAVPEELQTRSAANDRLVADILYAVLTQLQENAREHSGPELLRLMELPVPSRIQAIADLETRGYEVNGDVAILRKPRGGLVGKLAGLLSAEKVKVPQEATAAEFVELARRALGVLPGWPNDAESALRALIRPGNSAPVRTGIVPSLPLTSTPVVQKSIPPRPPPAPARPNDWMKDFLDAHTPPGGTKKAKISRSRPNIPALPPKKSNQPPEWLADFGSAPAAPAAPTASAPKKAPPREKKAKAPEPEPQQKPDWMKDFDS